jgi:hypothetical protein
VRRLAFAALLLGTAAVAAEGFKARGFVLPDGAVKIDEDRYRLTQPWDEAVRFYRRAYPPGKFTRRTLHNQSAVRAMYIENPEHGEWEGVNLYEVRGEVRVFILVPEQRAAAPAAPPAKGKSP